MTTHDDGTVPPTSPASAGGDKKRARRAQRLRETVLLVTFVGSLFVAAVTAWHSYHSVDGTAASAIGVAVLAVAVVVLLLRGVIDDPDKDKIVLPAVRLVGGWLQEASHTWIRAVGATVGLVVFTGTFVAACHVREITVYGRGGLQRVRWRSLPGVTDHHDFSEHSAATIDVWSPFPTFIDVTETLECVPVPPGATPRPIRSPDGRFECATFLAAVLPESTPPIAYALVHVESGADIRVNVNVADGVRYLALPGGSHQVDLVTVRSRGRLGALVHGLAGDRARVQARVPPEIATSNILASTTVNPAHAVDASTSSPPTDAGPRPIPRPPHKNRRADGGVLPAPATTCAPYCDVTYWDAAVCRHLPRTFESPYRTGDHLQGRVGLGSICAQPGHALSVSVRSGADVRMPMAGNSSSHKDMSVTLLVNDQAISNIVSNNANAEVAFPTREMRITVPGNGEVRFDANVDHCFCNGCTPGGPATCEIRGVMMSIVDLGPVE